MEALFIGQTYIDVTFLTDEIPTGDEKAVARGLRDLVRRQRRHGGLRLRQARRSRRTSSPRSPTTGSGACSSTWRRSTASRSITGRCANPRSPSSCRTAASAPSCAAATTIICIPFRRCNLDGCRALHLDGHQPDAAIHYAKACRERGILTSLDGGGLRSNTHELLAHRRRRGRRRAAVRADESRVTARCSPT